MQKIISFYVTDRILQCSILSPGRETVLFEDCFTLNSFEFSGSIDDNYIIFCNYLIKKLTKRTLKQAFVVVSAPKKYTWTEGEILTSDNHSTFLYYLVRYLEEIENPPKAACLEESIVQQLLLHKKKLSPVKQSLFLLGDDVTVRIFVVEQNGEMQMLFAREIELLRRDPVATIIEINRKLNHLELHNAILAGNIVGREFVNHLENILDCKAEIIRLEGFTFDTKRTSNRYFFNAQFTTVLAALYGYAGVENSTLLTPPTVGVFDQVKSIIRKSSYLFAPLLLSIGVLLGHINSGIEERELYEKKTQKIQHTKDAHIEDITRFYNLSDRVSRIERLLELGAGRKDTSKYLHDDLIRLSSLTNKGVTIKSITLSAGSVESLTIGVSSSAGIEQVLKSYPELHELSRTVDDSTKSFILCLGAKQ